MKGNKQNSPAVYNNQKYISQKKEVHINIL